MVQDEKSKARGTKNRILTEIEFNIDLIFDHYLEREIPAEKVIEKLKVQELAKAIDEGFDFKKMNKGKIDMEMTGDNPFLKNILDMIAKHFCVRFDIILSKLNYCLNCIILPMRRK